VSEMHDGLMTTSTSTNASPIAAPIVVWLSSFSAKIAAALVYLLVRTSFAPSISAFEICRWRIRRPLLRKERQLRRGFKVVSSVYGFVPVFHFRLDMARCARRLLYRSRRNGELLAMFQRVLTAATRKMGKRQPEQPGEGTRSIRLVVRCLGSTGNIWPRLSLEQPARMLQNRTREKRLQRVDAGALTLMKRALLANFWLPRGPSLNNAALLVSLGESPFGVRFCTSSSAHTHGP
jgi:hypothetical protein